MFNYETSLIQQIALIDICDHGRVVLRGKPEHLESNAANTFIAVITFRSYYTIYLRHVIPFVFRSL